MIRLSGPQKVLITLVSFTVAIAAGVIVYANFPDASNQGYAPAQPIPFSHKLHAGDNKIPCLYCHASAERSRHAGVPGLYICMKCHKVVKTGSPYIQQITQAYTEGRPIEWIRVHELPDFVYFPHKRHIAKGVSCETCHGNVKGMERIAQVAPLNMGWCLNCHNGVTTPQNVLTNTYPGVKDPHGPVAPRSCTTCHH